MQGKKGHKESAIANPCNHQIPDRSAFLNVGIFAKLSDKFGFPPALEPSVNAYMEVFSAITTFSKNPEEERKLPGEQNPWVPVGSWGRAHAAAEAWLRGHSLA